MFDVFSGFSQGCMFKVEFGELHMVIESFVLWKDGVFPSFNTLVLVPLSVDVSCFGCATVLRSRNKVSLVSL